MQTRNTIAAGLLGLAFAASASATPIPVQFFHSPNNDGQRGTGSLPATGSIVLNLWADVSLVNPTDPAINPAVMTTAPIVYEVTDVRLVASGMVSIVSFTCGTTAPNACLQGTVNSGQINFTAGNANDPGNSAPFRIGTLTIDASGVGAISLLFGDALDGNFNSDAIVQHTVVLAPEPAIAALLGLGLGGVALLGRKRAA